MDLTELFCDVDNFVTLHMITIEFTYVLIFVNLGTCLLWFWCLRL